MKVFATNFNFTPTWLLEGDYDFTIYDRSDSRDYLKDFPQEKILYEPNAGDADFSKLTWLINNYHDLPDVFLWTKSNLFKFITPEEFDEVKDNKHFTPLLTKNHKVYEPICRYEGGLYAELNNSWYLGSAPSYYFDNYHQFAASFNLEDPQYLRFAPGGSYILTRETVHKYAVDFYKDLASLLPYAQRPGEAQFLERSYYNIWK